MKINYLKSYNFRKADTIKSKLIDDNKHIFYR